ncbi:relaxase/mobilization nuclease domain-containing protein [uncultured Oscillibacter sp.]|uniref:relaxase/mobilization nuclease domain-containing protein n=1 Tax=uncultured Oscillibacter sp. TaxID=876091 RepID=UPI0026034910|nr:relaxase/mobilization nuclease domain-containing protein [uncultured Oscillibacter sp.]
MAVTSIWPIKGRVDRVINYARNPEKTTEASYEELASLHAIDNVVEYAADDMKTERRSYVSCINLRSEQTAAQEFMDTKRNWKNLGGRTCYHGYQSFKAGEVTAETAHEIGVKLAQELWGDRFEVVVATHCNTGHYHNHFVINSVSCVDGYKFYNSPADYARMREVSDRLCREYAISVIENPGGRAKNYAEWQAEQNGKPTHRGTIRADIDRAILASTTERDFLRVMGEMGYQLKTRDKGGQPLKYPALKPPDAGGYFRFHKLGEGYSLDEIKERILHNLQKQVPFPEAVHRPPRRYRVRGKPRKKITGLRALYFRYCYELHIIVKKPASVKRVSFLLREDIAKLDRLDAETRFLGKHRIGTIGELTAHRETASAEVDALTAQRQELRKELRRCNRQGDPVAVGEVKQKISALSSRIRAARKEVVLCDGIAQRSGQVRENLERLVEQKETERKELTQHELFRRRGGAGREAVPGNR